MRHEIRKHWEKLKKLSKLTEEQLQVSYTQVVARLKFINEEIIPAEIWLEAEQPQRFFQENLYLAQPHQLPILVMASALR